MPHPDNRPDHIDTSAFSFSQRDLDAVRAEWAKLPEVNEERLFLERLERLQAKMRERDLGGMVLYDPVNHRYATGVRNMQVWAMHNSSRYCLVPVEGKAVMFDFINCEHMSEGLPTVAEARPAKLWLFHAAGRSREKVIEEWADELADAIREYCPNGRIGVDRMDGELREALGRRQISVSFGQDLVEYARCIKTQDELTIQRRNARICTRALSLMREATRPGVTENELWAILVGVNSALDGDYTESRMVVSGPRTNPWYTEASDKKLEAGELLGIDTDMVGPYSYSCDMSRTWLCEPGAPTPEQKELYSLAYDQVHENMRLIKAGMSFQELVERSWRIPDRFADFECGCIIHGIGMCNEYPMLAPRKAYDPEGYDGHLEENMTICVESYIGERGGREGVKLEQMMRVTENGYELISDFPFEETLLN
jgi:Xaa-Pro dipeptidase